MILTGDTWTRKVPELTFVNREHMDAVTNSNHSTDAFQAGCIFTGQCGRPKLDVTQGHVQFLVECRFNTPQMASFLDVSQRAVERRLREFNLNIKFTASLKRLTALSVYLSFTLSDIIQSKLPKHEPLRAHITQYTE